MTLQQLHYALTAAKAGSMNKAAEQLYVSQSTLTGALRDLESEIGVSIFKRTNRGVSPTNEGEDFLRYARQVYQQFELLESNYISRRAAKPKFGVSAQHYSFVDKAFVETVKQCDARQFEFAIRETRTELVIQDVGSLRSEIGVLFRSDHNRKVIGKMLRDQSLEFHRLVDCQAYVYLWRGHPLAARESISFQELEEYPCLMFEQGDGGSSFLAEEILSEKSYHQLIYTNDRATNLNLMVGLNAYTLCSGIICEELNGTEFVAIPYREDEENRNITMEIGYIHKKGLRISEVGEIFLREIQKYLGVPERAAGQERPAAGENGAAGGLCRRPTQSAK